MHLNRIKSKKLHFELHKEFLSKCLQGNLIPNGLRINLEPMSVNLSNKFVTEWYQNQEECTKKFMKLTI